ncbi:Undecaprenyl pyrophosphate synthetase 2 (UPP synthetase 2) (Di-trans,poly-cis-decaprenylcistransferase 2) (Undecaprenyl diphosphate synthase 2) (UDS 2) [Polymorphum gilvum SL003B-26A1]|uniref:Isoprenyl transferase n=1 Tax=Polymorphum gilvum (strain LMG 25793 / CGMCC 1.9160 / SL003B-26A1) TaxID=991905 RepID=F2IY19_POLGS|nr:Undecaprenyl pyrophosphate synthetase 2 (UPP synthetase 2) (Di-trans,poly-cis-decaprenylcistransferase 2) (Undecaprenyl diphosphate synthase 2) (UDS 2) [Polymorphum gilvum SL003B-26A1]
MALIMDGNGRWAQARGLPRTEGHRHGLEALRATIRRAAEVGIDYVTVFSFSSENWARPDGEVSYLMGLLRRFVQRDLSEIHQANIRVRVIGAREGLEPGIRGLLEEAETLTRANTGMTLVVAFNYGGRDELVRAVKALAEDVAQGRLRPEAITEDDISRRLDTAGIPDPDLIIRTSGELRLSNFLLWQAAYTEFYFSPVLWPDFDAAAFDDALTAFAERDRRYGGLSAKIR